MTCTKVRSLQPRKGCGIARVAGRPCPRWWPSPLSYPPTTIITSILTLGWVLPLPCRISGFIYVGFDEKVCWNRAINLLIEESSGGLQPSPDPRVASALSTGESSPLTAETLEAQLNVLRMARRYVGMCICLVPSGPKTLCNRLMEYRRASSLNSIGRFTEV